MPAEMIRPHTRTRKKRATGPDHAARTSAGAAAAERASAGMGTADIEPTDWLFGNSLSQAGASAARRAQRRT